MSSTLITVGVGVSAALALLGVLFFFQTKDPMALLMALQPIAWTWGIVLVLHVLKHGIPVRIVDERRQP